MSNYNTIAGMPGTSASGNVIAETAFGIAPANTVRATVGIPGSFTNSAIDGREILLRAGILITGGTTTNYTPSIRLNSGGNTNLTTFTSDTAIVTPTAFAVNSVTRLCTIAARLSWDATTARLNGAYAFNIDTTFTNWATLTAGLSAGVTNATSIVFLLTGIFSATNAGNTAVLKYFEMDVDAVDAERGRGRGGATERLCRRLQRSGVGALRGRRPRGEPDGGRIHELRALRAAERHQQLRAVLR
jgi:hypothetical protein